MGRQLTEHLSNTCNNSITISVEDEVGSGGANHYYKVSGFDLTSNPSSALQPLVTPAPSERDSISIIFQNGPIQEVGTNGLTHEILLAILIDRMRSFQSGPYACRENALALTKLEEALMWLNRRTASRVSRGVEGTHTV